MIDWDALTNQAAELLSGYLQIASLNPPGNERAAAEYLAAQLRARGLQPTLYESAPNRFNLLARLPGAGTKKPILLYNHMDVVEADPTRWSSNPFSGQIRDGYVWGRGAIDMKGMGIMQLLALDLLQQHQPRRSRDVIFFAAADEEKGSTFGTRWVIEHHWNEIEAEFVWDEGGFGLRDFFGPQPVFTVAVAEKKDLWLKVIAYGEPGHSGMPHANNAIDILLKALTRLQGIDSVYELHPIPRRMFRDLADRMPFPRSLLLRNLDNPLFFRLALSALTADPTIAAMLKDTMSITVLQAGGKENVIPDRAEATLDLRLLPDRRPAEVVEKLKRLVDDPRIEFQILQAPEPATTSSPDSEFFRALSSTIRELVPNSLVTPILTPGTTDSTFFRQKGAQSYGLFPIIITPNELARFHGIDERISLDNLRLGLQLTYRVLEKMLQADSSVL